MAEIPLNPITVDFTTSNGFTELLRSLNFSLAVSTYQTGNLFLIGPAAGEQLRVSSVVLDRPMGLAVEGESLFVGGLFQISRFNNVLPRGKVHEGADRLLTPHLTWTTGEVDCHDVVIEADGRIVFVNTLYSCLAALSSEHNFIPIWRPPHISGLAPEDRCHLNGVAIRDGRVRYASAFSVSDVKHGWKTKKDGTGVVWDLTTNKTVIDGLSMPHSPRWHDGQLWLLESSTGQFGRVNITTRKLEPVITLPGYLRGLTFHGSLAIIGSSLPRPGSDIDRDAFAKNVAARETSPSCGIFFVDTKSGKLLHFVRVSKDVQELYDIAVLTGCQAPEGIGFKDQRVRYILKIG